MKALVLLSGGIDSTVLLAGALVNKTPCAAITFDYKQRHRREIKAATQIAKYYKVEHQVIDLPSIFGASALTGQYAVPNGHAEQPDATVVPARNLVLLTTAAAIADRDGYGMVAFGANADDAGGYPDCRPQFIENLREAIQLGTAGHVWLHTPFIYNTKREIIELGKALKVPLEMTWSCYRGEDAPCDACGACVSRNEAMA